MGMGLEWLIVGISIPDSHQAVNEPPRPLQPCYIVHRNRKQGGLPENGGRQNATGHCEDPVVRWQDHKLELSSAPQEVLILNV